LDDTETEQQTSVEKVEVKDKNNNQIDVNSMDLYDEYADKADENEYYFIIDEINRADLSKVFGELMFGLEESYRGVENRFDTQYKNLKTYEIGSDGKARPMAFDCFEKGFFIPDNLYIIGTMNDIDRSVEAFDFALRRRFQWIDIKANEVMLYSLKSMLSKKNITDDEIEGLAGKIIDMNNYLSKSENKYGLTEAYHIGPAYFKTYDPNVSNSLETIFRQRIEPIIREYTRGRAKVDELVENCRKALLNNQ
jgi:5-methylcytosine-specific restriction endonuclease McrBC GTP-binding regulatory subunit McrB